MLCTPNRNRSPGRVGHFAFRAEVKIAGQREITLHYIDDSLARQHRESVDEIGLRSMWQLSYLSFYREELSVTPF